MIRISELKLGLDSDRQDLYEAAAAALKLPVSRIRMLTIARRSIDSRKKD